MEKKSRSSRICTSSLDPSETHSRGSKSKSRHEQHRPGHHHDSDERRKRGRSSERRRERDRRKEEDEERRSRDDEKRRKWSRSGEKSSSSGSANIVDASSSTYSSVRGSDGSSQVETTEQVALTCDQRSHPPPGSKDVKLLPLHQEGKKEGDPELKTGTSTTLTASSSFPTSSLLLTSLNPIQTASSSNLVVVPGLLNQRQKQEEKKKLLWGDTSSHEKQQQKVRKKTKVQVLAPITLHFFLQ